MLVSIDCFLLIQVEIFLVLSMMGDCLIETWKFAILRYAIKSYLRLFFFLADFLWHHIHGWRVFYLTVDRWEFEVQIPTWPTLTPGGKSQLLTVPAEALVAKKQSALIWPHVAFAGTAGEQGLSTTGQEPKSWSPTWPIPTCPRHEGAVEQSCYSLASIEV